MQRCKTCKHWDNKEIGYGGIYGTGTCSAIPQLFDASEWSEDGERMQINPKYSEKLAFTQDGSDYKAWLVTLPDFGCVMHEPSTAQIDKP